jgi:hypothetical protein
MSEAPTNVKPLLERFQQRRRRRRALREMIRLLTEIDSRPARSTISISR